MKYVLYPLIFLAIAACSKDEASPGVSTELLQGDWTVSSDSYTHYRDGQKLYEEPGNAERVIITATTWEVHRPNKTPTAVPYTLKGTTALVGQRGREEPTEIVSLTANSLAIRVKSTQFGPSDPIVYNAYLTR